MAGLIAALAATHLYAKNVYIFDLYEAVIESERARLGLPSVQLDGLRQLDLPANTQYVKRQWDSSWWRRRLVVGPKAATVWLAALCGFALIDFLLVAYSIAGLAGWDPGWFTQHPMPAHHPHPHPPPMP